MSSFLLTHGSALKLSPEASSGPGAQSTKQVWSIGQVDPAFLDEGAGRTQEHSRCYHPRLGLIVLGTSGTAFFLNSETVATMTRTCREDDGKSELGGARNRIVNPGKGTVVPHTCASPPHTIVFETIIVVSIHDTLEANEFRLD